MPEFLHLSPAQAAFEQWSSVLRCAPEGELVDTVQALGRVTFRPIIAPLSLPSFSRSAVDGYAVRSRDTHGASEALPAYLRLAGEIPMGSRSELALGTGDCALIHTGGMLPSGADAVVMLEHTQVVRATEIEVLRAVANGENILELGEDVQAGEQVIPAGVVLRPAEIGGLMALGITRLEVASKPRIGLISSGDEVVTPGGDLKPGQVYDVNSYSLGALVESAGAIPVRYGIVPDVEAALYDAASRAHKECQVVAITAGSSASARDFTSRVIESLGPPGVLVHGVNVRPGKPTILAACAAASDQSPKAVIGLPGNPVSALVIAGLFLVPLIDLWLGKSGGRQAFPVRARLTVNLPSQAGREDWVPVALSQVDQDLQAEPIFGKSNLIFSLARADGLLHIPADATGLPAGAVAQVFLL